MIKSKALFYTKYFVLFICSLLIVLGCAAPEMEEMDTVLSQTEVAPSVVKVSNVSTEALVGKMRITIEADSELTYTAFKLTDPLRLVLDLPNVDTTQVSEKIFTDTLPIMRITPFQFTEADTVNSRIEVALSRLVPYQVFSDANKLFIDLEMPVEEVAVAPSTPSALPPGFEELAPTQEKLPLVVESKPEDVVEPLLSQPGVPTIEIAKPPETVGEVTTLAEVLAAPSAISVIKDVEVSEVNGKTRITLYATKAPEFDLKRSDSPPRLTIDLKQSDLLPEAEKVVSPDELETLVKQVRVFQLRRTPDGTDNVVRVLVDLMRPTRHEVTTEPEKLVLDIEHPAVLAGKPMVEGEEIAEVPLTTGIEEALKEEGAPEEEELAPAPTIRAPKTGEEKEYKGQLISIHFQEGDIKDVLDVIAEVSGLNLVIHPGVTGTVSVRLENIPWDQALDIILKMNNLAVEIEGNILRVAQADVFQQEVAQQIAHQQQQIEAQRVQAELEPLETKLITVNFVDTATMQGLIESYFAGQDPERQQQRRGTITPDSRTKTLIVQDTAENIKKIEEIVTTLDRRTPQVLIEARVVSLTSSFRKELGISWTGRFTAAPQYGNALNYRFPYTVDIPNFGVNLPIVSDPVGTTGPITFGSIDDVISIFARIDAAEEEFKATTLGQPKIFTQDNLTADVSTGQTVTIPPTGDADEATEVEAKLSLTVTPRISRDGYVTMEVQVTNDALDLATLTVTEQAVNSTVTVKDGETVVIGGVYQTIEVDSFRAVPFLHRIPILGHLFKSNLPNEQSQRELLVFLTPRILDRKLLKPEQEGLTEIY